MKAIFIVCVAVISGLFLYQPQIRSDFENKTAENNTLAPELLECKYYQQEIEKNLRNSKHK